MTNLAHESNQSGLPLSLPAAARAGALVLAVCLVGWVATYLAGATGIESGAGVREDLALAATVAAGVAALGLLALVVRNPGSPWAELGLALVGGGAGVLAWRAAASWGAQTLGLAIVVLAIATICLAFLRVEE